MKSENLKISDDKLTVLEKSWLKKSQALFNPYVGIHNRWQKFLIENSSTLLPNQLNKQQKS